MTRLHFSFHFTRFCDCCEKQRNQTLQAENEGVQDTSSRHLNLYTLF